MAVLRQGFLGSTENQSAPFSCFGVALFPKKSSNFGITMKTEIHEMQEFLPCPPRLTF